MTDEYRPEKIFRVLRRSRAAEADSEALWRRIEARLEPPSPATASRLLQPLTAATRRPGLQLAGAVTAIAAVAIAIWWQPIRVGETAPLIAMPAPVADALVSVWELDVRLVRGFDGAPPADVRPEVVDGAGGASRLADLRADLASLVRFEDFGLVGEWTGEIQEADGEVPLSNSRALAFELVGVDADNGALQLRNVWLEGEERLKVASEMTLTPGDPHVVGVRPGAEVETGGLFLAIAVRPRAAPATEPADGPQE